MEGDESHLSLGAHDVTKVERFEVEIRTLNGTRHTLEVDETTTVTSVKTQIVKGEANTSTVKLMVGTTILSDRKKDGSHYRIGEPPYKISPSNNKLMLLQRFHGGGGTTRTGVVEVSNQLRKMNQKYLREGLIGVEPLGEGMEWLVLLRGPKGSPYESGVFEVILSFPYEYPRIPPKIKFQTPIWHPNVYADTNFLCYGCGENGGNYQAHVIVAGVAALMAQPNPSSPANREASDMFVSNRKAFESTARDYTRQHASVM